MIATQHTTRVIPRRADAEGPHKCERCHTSNATASPSPLVYAQIAEHTETSLEPQRDFVRSLAPLGMTPSDARERK